MWWINRLKVHTWPLQQAEHRLVHADLCLGPGEREEFFSVEARIQRHACEFVCRQSGIIWEWASWVLRNKLPKISGSIFQSELRNAPSAKIAATSLRASTCGAELLRLVCHEARSFVMCMHQIACTFTECRRYFVSFVAYDCSSALVDLISCLAPTRGCHVALFLPPGGSSGAAGGMPCWPLCHSICCFGFGE